MATRDTFVTVADGDQLNDGYFNELGNLYGSYILQNAINANKYTVSVDSLTPLETGWTDILTSDSAAVKTNWTYNATDDTYENTQTSEAILSFTDLLTDKQFNNLDGGNLTRVLPLFIFNDAGEEDATVVTNPSFETYSTGFTGWTETPGVGTISQTTSNVTDGTFAAQMFIDNFYDSNNEGNCTMTQSIDVTGIKYVAIDYYALIQQVVGSDGSSTVTALVSVGAVSDSVTVQDGSGGGDSDSDTGTFILDVSSLTGTQTLTLRATSSSGSGSSRQWDGTVRWDNVRTITDGGAVANLTRAIEVTADGSNWETATNGEWHTFTNTGQSLGVRVRETRSDGSTLLKDVVVEGGLLYK